MKEKDIKIMNEIIEQISNTSKEDLDRAIKMADEEYLQEDIKVLEKFINNYKLIQEKYKDDEIQAEIEKSCYFEEVPAQAIENLIAGYKELEKENKTLKGFTNSIFNDTLETDYIPKSKVRKKIEEAKHRYNELHSKHYRDCGIAEAIEEAKIEGYEELLQEGDK